MPRSRFCRCCKDFHDLDQAWPAACAGHFGTQSQGAAPFVISDTIDPFRSMADGLMYDSKSRYRRDLAARGLAEVGNDRIERRETPMPPIRDSLRQTLEQLRG